MKKLGFEGFESISRESCTWMKPVQRKGTFKIEDIVRVENEMSKLSKKKSNKR